jgi:hypothetical protein
MHTTYAFVYAGIGHAMAKEKECIALSYLSTTNLAGALVSYSR